MIKKKLCKKHLEMYKRKGWYDLLKEEYEFVEVPEVKKGKSKCEVLDHKYR